MSSIYNNVGWEIYIKWEFNIKQTAAAAEDFVYLG